MSPSLSVVLGVGLLFSPLWLLHGPDARLAAFDQKEWPRGRNLMLVFLDAARAALGAWLLASGMPDLPHMANAPVWAPELALAGVVGVALTIQTLAWRDEDHVQAPVVFLGGLAAVLFDPVVAVLVLPLAVGAALALRAWSGVFLAASLGAVGIGWMLNAQSWGRVIFVGAVLGCPVLVSILAGRHMAWPRK